MVAKKIIIFFVVSCFIGTALSQMSTQTEYEYLLHINKQKNKALIKQNLFQAQIKVLEILKRPIKSNVNSYFIAELANSYFFLREYDKSFLYYTLQRTLFHNDSIEKQSAFSYEISAQKMGKTMTDIGELQIVYKEAATMNYNDKLLKWLEININIFSISNTELLQQYSTYVSPKIKLPAWLQHWQWLTVIKLSEKDKVKVLSKPLTHDLLWEQVESRMAKKILFKTFRYYLSNNSKEDAKKIQSVLQNTHRSVLCWFRCNILIIRYM